ncbi:MarR family winged helix-turn-helix transcriptional regulator [Sagittula sp. MA-2]|jgi:DNA-binding MarR family transcriptional regulator|uniref:MarR family winged helix-turn-helix transcriptional regulator n=1 Tax=Sagittula sp. MA-2 TaxID=3048007 RepID=UPI0024C336CB|nr:MarR family transcriptional regulator [Sagittula sp. MA-2]WHZ34197.1 MarR family transcriptional regulator [Sagittula sp. MA-2]
MPEGDEALAFGPLANSLGFLLRLSQLRSFAQFYSDFESAGMRPGEWSVLLMLAENPGVRQGVLAKALRIKRAHMTKMVHGMEAEGLVRRTVPQGDKRSVELWLTEEGTARVDALRPSFVIHEGTSPVPLSDAEAEQLKTLLRRYLKMES